MGAHEGHLHVSFIAKKQLNLNEIWWLVTPQNRLKQDKISDTYFQRLKETKKLVSKYTFIKVLDYEYQFDLNYSYKSLFFLKNRSRTTKFVWIMGSDNIKIFQNGLDLMILLKYFLLQLLKDQVILKIYLIHLEQKYWAIALRAKED